MDGRWTGTGRRAHRISRRAAVICVLCTPLPPQIMEWRMPVLLMFLFLSHGLVYITQDRCRITTLIRSSNSHHYPPLPRFYPISWSAAASLLSTRGLPFAYPHREHTRAAWRGVSGGRAVERNGWSQNSTSCNCHQRALYPSRASK